MQQEIPIQYNNNIMRKNEDYKRSACPDCSQEMQKPYWEPLYNGFLEKCDKCNVTWKLSEGHY